MKTVPVKKAPRLALASIKTFEGHEGHGLNADLYFDGKNVAFVLDEGNGGDVDIQWTDGYHNSPTEARIKQYIGSLTFAPMTLRFEDGDFAQPRDLRTLIDETVDDWHNEKRVSHLAKKYVLFRTPEQPQGEFYKLAHNDHPETCKARILMQYPDATFIEHRK